MNITVNICYKHQVCIITLIKNTKHISQQFHVNTPKIRMNTFNPSPAESGYALPLQTV